MGAEAFFDKILDVLAFGGIIVLVTLKDSFLGCQKITHNLLGEGNE